MEPHTEINKNLRRERNFLVSLIEQFVVQIKHMQINMRIFREPRQIVTLNKKHVSVSIFEKTEGVICQRKFEFRYPFKKEFILHSGAASEGNDFQTLQFQMSVAERIDEPAADDEQNPSTSSSARNTLLNRIRAATLSVLTRLTPQIYFLYRTEVPFQSTVLKVRSLKSKSSNQVTSENLQERRPSS